LASSNISASSATSSWTAVSGAVSYAFEYKTSSATTWTVQTVTGTTVNLTGLTASTTYNTRVKTNCSSNTSGYSGTINFTTSAPPACNAPTGLASSNISASSATSSWTAVSGAVSYAFEYKTSSATTWTVQTVTGTTVNLTGLTASTTYNTRVKTNCSSNTSGYSGTINFTTSAPPACNAPTGLVTSNVSYNTATSSWIAVSGALSYAFEYKTSSATTWTVQTVTGTSINLSGLTAGTTYNTRVKTNCNGNTSGYSSTVNFNTTASCTDNYENNNSAGTAKNITVGAVLTAKIGSSSDIDWYKFSNTNASKNIRVTLTNVPADYDLKLYRGTSTQVGVSENRGTVNEEIKYNNTLASTTYYVQVYGYNSAFNNNMCYSLLAQIGSGNFRVGEEFTDAESTQVTDEFLLFPNPALNDVTLVVPFGPNGEGTLSILDMTGKMVKIQKLRAEPGIKTYNFDTSFLHSGMYIFNFMTEDKLYTQKLLITDRR
jgi:hypothetical protein